MYLFLCLFLVSSALLFIPALSGPILLDDQANLKILNLFNQNANFSLTDFFSELHSQGKFKRPISLLSFALQHDSWPDKIENFKLINIMLHYINAILVGLLSYLLAKKIFFTQSSQNHCLWFAVISACIWLIHPMQQSSVFYIVQRMTQLSSFFMLLGMITYLYLRPRLNLNQFKHFLLLTFSIGICLSLAILSKGNGLLLIAYLMLFEFLLQRQAKSHSLQKKQIYFHLFQFLIFFLPLVLFLIYLYFQWPFLSGLGEIREFTPYERFLTESRILISYLYFILIPDIFYGGLFHDNITISRNIFSPYTTISSIITIIILLLVAWKLRKKHLIIFSGISFFFISHLMESTFLPLELYFEHRNYLAILGIIWLIIYLFQISFKSYHKITVFVASSYIIIIVLFSWSGAQIWSDRHSLVINWAQYRVYSPRSQNYLAYFWLDMGQKQKGLDVFRQTRINMPRELSLRTLELLYSCRTDTDTLSIQTELINDINNKRLHVALADFFLNIYKEYSEGNCINLSNAGFQKILVTISQHPRANKNIKIGLNQIIGKLKSENIREIMQQQGFKNIKIY